jgi:hypothetical protein
VAEVQKEVRKELTGLPYYGVFDLLTFQVSDQGLEAKQLWRSGGRAQESARGCRQLALVVVPAAR